MTQRINWLTAIIGGMALTGLLTAIRHDQRMTNMEDCIVHMAENIAIHDRSINAMAEGLINFRMQFPPGNKPLQQSIWPGWPGRPDTAALPVR